ncbi:hypothetical protein [Jeotgalibacillus malaysiensis]|uniref:hypothetical protein n=1 Tax=Jeotgalibacillus malaysiensis TaxID=1508404 RepID=UPI00384EB5FF
MKESNSKKKGYKYWVGFGLTIFAGMTLVAIVNDQEIVWSKQIAIPLVWFFEWAWDSKEYGKKT